MMTAAIIKNAIAAFLSASFIALLLLAGPASAAPAKHPSQCLVVIHTQKLDASHYEALVYNRCGETIKEAAVLVKFFNAKWERVGVSGFVLNYTAPFEVVRHAFTVEQPFTFVGVRAITDNALDSLK